MTRRARRVGCGLAALLFLSGVAVVVWGFALEPDRLLVHEETLDLENWPRALDDLRVVAASDFHVGSPHVDLEKLERIVREVNRLDPDLVVLLGDYVIRGVRGGRFVPPEAIAERLAELRARTAVVAVLGNHEWWFDGFRVRRALERVGLPVLENEVLRCERKGQALYLAGLADAWTRSPDVEGTLLKVPPGEPVVVLTHNPDVFPTIPARVNLTLGGHTHGGQVRLPLLGSPVVPSRFGQRYARGHVVEGGRQLFVTTGIGTSIVPVRIGVPPEIVVLTLKTKRVP